MGDRETDRDYIERGFRRCADYGIEPDRVFSRRILEEAFRLRMVPGAFMDESSIGTNAMGTALAEGRPVQVSGEEHVIRAYHRWTCSGAPIRDSAGRIVGALDLTGRKEAVHLHTLGMVVSAVAAIEQTLALEARNHALSEQRRFVETLVDSIKAGIVSADLEGRILSVNAQALEMFGHSREEMEELGMSGLLPRWEEIRRALLAGSEFQNEDVAASVRANRLYFNLGTYPILGPSGKPEALILVFKDVKKVRKHANEILGRRAIYTFDKIIGVSPALRAAVDFARRVADSRSTVLITGESGTGKEIFAQAIQNASSRRGEAFVVLNCGAIPRTLIESELFGYAEGAFTGAKRGGQPGKFEIADGGTIFLDEIGEMPLDMQIRLLRVIEEGTVMRVGDNREIPVDVRIIAATNKDLALEVERGNFRMDLYYRLNVLPIRLPPLRERREDIPLLVDYYMEKISRKLNKRPVPMGRSYLEGLCAQAWPGNVRELENFLELAINGERLPELGQGEPVGARGGAAAAALGASPEAAAEARDRGARPGAAARSAEVGPARLESLALGQAEELLVRRALAETGYNISRAAKRLGIGRTTLYRKLERYGIECSEAGHCADLGQSEASLVS